MIKKFSQFLQEDAYVSFEDSLDINKILKKYNKTILQHLQYTPIYRGMQYNDTY